MNKNKQIKIWNEIEIEIEIDILIYTDERRKGIFVWKVIIIHI